MPLFARLAMLSGSVALLSGCVALVLPVAAGGVIARKKLRHHESVPVAVAAATTPVAAPVPAPSAAPDVIVPAPTSTSLASQSPTQPDPVPPPMQDPATANAGAPLAEAHPAELALATPSPRAQGAAPTSRLKDFTDFALNEHDAGNVGVERRSAVLAAATSLLDPLALPCGKRPSAVIVDVDVLASPEFSGQLAAAVEMLRANKIAVLWIGGNHGARDGVRARLASAGLSAMLGDRILETRSTSERKQVLRQEAAAQFCIVAIAGARRGDMDELYDYLRSDADAFKLNRRWGAGWFLMAAAH